MAANELQRQIKDVYERYGSLVYARCMRFLKSEEQAWDATQEVFIKLMNSFTTIEKKDSIFSWLLHTSTNHCISILRKKKAIEFNEEFHSGENQSLAQDVRLILKDIVKRLMMPWDKKTREIVIYAYLDGYKQDEISRLTGMGQSTIRKYLTRFKRKSLYWKQQQKESFCE